MITAWQNSDRSEIRILAKGNFSLDAGGLVNLLLALAAVTLFLAGLLAWQGYWPVLLIAVIQVVLVGLILIRAWQKSWVRDTIDVGPERIVVEQQRHQRKRRIELASAWAVVVMKQADVSWYGPRLLLRSGSSSVELGEFLTTEEKHRLAVQLRSAIEKHSAM